MTLQKQEAASSQACLLTTISMGSATDRGLEAEPVRIFGSFWLVQKEAKSGISGIQTRPLTQEGAYSSEQCWNPSQESQWACGLRVPPRHWQPQTIEGEQGQFQVCSLKQAARVCPVGPALGEVSRRPTGSPTQVVGRCAPRPMVSCRPIRKHCIHELSAEDG